MSTQPRVTLRISEARDAAAIREVAEAAWWKTYDGILPKSAIEEALMSHYADDAVAAALAEGQQWLLAEYDGQLQGFCATEYFPATHILFIHKLYVHPERQGSGSGKTLMQAAMRLVPQARTLQLLVNRQNAKAQRFYLRLGMRIRQAVTVIASREFVKEDYLLEYILPGEAEKAESAPVQAPPTAAIV